MANLRKWRESAGLTQLRVAEQIGISTATIIRYEAGTREPRATELVRMAQLFGCTVDDLLLENPTPPPSSREREEASQIAAVNRPETKSAA